MKVFDFTSGVKGKKLADIPRANSTGGWFVEKGAKVFKVQVAGNQDIKWSNGATFWDHASKEEFKINPEDYGVEAVCFCMGEFDTEWWWHAVATCGWNREAVKSGILNAEFVRYA